MEVAGAIAVSANNSGWGSSQYYNFVAVTGIIVATILIFFNVINVVEKMSFIPWNLLVILELYNNNTVEIFLKGILKLKIIFDS